MRPLVDTIVAPITAPGAAGVAIIRLSGSEAWRIAESLFDPFPTPPEPRRACFGSFPNGDDGILLLFKGPASFTGEDCAELQCHGSPASVRQLVSLCQGLGARHAEPGEFSKRAWLNGKIELTQAEGIADTINAQSAEQLRNANRLRRGDLGKAAGELQERCLSALAEIEAHVDFSEELGPLDAPRLIADLGVISEVLQGHILRARYAELLRDGAKVAILGRPNAGKSSLLNALTRSDRAIVTPIPGTTRDYIEATVEVEGLLVRLIDTAGLRHTTDAIEREGVERSRAIAADADLCVLLYDAAQGWQPEDEQALTSIPVGKETLVAANKIDLAVASRGTGISCATGAGLAELTKEIASRLLPQQIRDEPIGNARHHALLASALEFLVQAQKALADETVPDDFAAVHLREATLHLSQITGTSLDADWADAIFSRFCIGK